MDTTLRNLTMLRDSLAYSNGQIDDGMMYQVRQINEFVSNYSHEKGRVVTVAQELTDDASRARLRVEQVAEEATSALRKVTGSTEAAFAGLTGDFSPTDLVDAVTARGESSIQEHKAACWKNIVETQGSGLQLVGGLEDLFLEGRDVYTAASNYHEAVESLPGDYSQMLLVISLLLCSVSCMTMTLPRRIP